MRIFDDCSVRATYFARDTADEMEIRQLAMALYERTDSNWACDHGPTLTLGWVWRLFASPFAGEIQQGFDDVRRSSADCAAPASGVDGCRGPAQASDLPVGKLPFNPN